MNGIPRPDSEAARPEVIRLIQMCAYGERLFAQAATHCADPQLGRLLRSYSHQRARFASELLAQLRRAAGERSLRMTSDGDAAANLENPASSSNAARLTDADLLSSCQTEEEETLRAYQQALQKPMPLGCRFLVQAQQALIGQAQRHLKSLPASARAATPRTGGLTLLAPAGV